MPTHGNSSNTERPGPGEMTTFPGGLRPQDNRGPSLTERQNLADLVLTAALALHHAEAIVAATPEKKLLVRHLRSAKFFTLEALKILSPQHGPDVFSNLGNDIGSDAIEAVCAVIRRQREREGG